MPDSVTAFRSQADDGEARRLGPGWRRYLDRCVRLLFTALVLAKHEVSGREFTGLDMTVPSRTSPTPGGPQRTALQVHAVAEEQFFCPSSPEDHEVGSKGWCEAVRATRQVNADHVPKKKANFFPRSPTRFPPISERPWARADWRATTSTFGPRGCRVRTLRSPWCSASGCLGASESGWYPPAEDVCLSRPGNTWRLVETD